MTTCHKHGDHLLSSEPLCVTEGVFEGLGAGGSSGGNSIRDYRAKANPYVPVLALFG